MKKIKNVVAKTFFFELGHLAIETLGAYILIGSFETALIYTLTIWAVVFIYHCIYDYFI